MSQREHFINTKNNMKLVHTESTRGLTERLGQRGGGKLPYKKVKYGSGSLGFKIE